MQRAGEGGFGSGPLYCCTGFHIKKEAEISHVRSCGGKSAGALSQGLRSVASRQLTHCVTSLSRAPPQKGSHRMWVHVASVYIITGVTLWVSEVAEGVKVRG